MTGYSNYFSPLAIYTILVGNTSDELLIRTEIRDNKDHWTTKLVPSG